MYIKIYIGIRFTNVRDSRFRENKNVSISNVSIICGNMSLFTTVIIQYYNIFQYRVYCSNS